MAENVELERENWTEFQKIRESQLLSDEEIKEVQRERTNNLYRLQKQHTCKDDYLQYIQFEENLLTKIKERREKTGLKMHVKEIENKIRDRLKEFYRRFLQKYGHDLDLWQLFIKFCRDNDLIATGTSMVRELVERNGGIERVYLYAAEWELFRHDRSEAMDWLQKGIDRHPKSLDLQYEVIKLQVEFIAHPSRTSKDKKPGSFLDEQFVEVLKAIYDNARENITDFTFYSKLLNLTVENIGARSLHDAVVKDLAELFPNNEAAWDLRAFAQLVNFDENSASVVPSRSIPLKDLEKVSLTQKGVESAVNVYEEALLIVPTVTMWDYFLDFLFKINKNESLSNKSSARLLWCKNIDRAMNLNKLSEKHYIITANSGPLLHFKSQRILSILQSAVECYPLSPKLWYSLLRHHLSRERLSLGLAVFREANEKLLAVPAHLVFPLWQAIFLYLTYETDKELNDMFMEGLKQRAELKRLIMTTYVTLKAVLFGIDEARQLAKLIEVRNTPCKEFYRELLHYELLEPELSLKYIRQWFEELVVHFGKADASIWIDYVEFEKKDGDVMKSSSLEQRALAQLSNEQADIFKTKSFTCFSQSCVTID